MAGTPYRDEAVEAVFASHAKRMDSFEERLGRLEKRPKTPVGPPKPWYRTWWGVALAGFVGAAFIVVVTFGIREGCREHYAGEARLARLRQRADVRTCEGIGARYVTSLNRVGSKTGTVVCADGPTVITFHRDAADGTVTVTRSDR